MNDFLYSQHIDTDNCCIAINDFTPFRFENIITKDKEMKNIVLLAKRVAESEASIILYGPSGSGKEVIAEHIHKNSKRSEKPLIKLNCASIPESLFESEIFGYDAGAFTGASRYGKKGVMELAENGTLFLDEIGEMPLSIQAKLLRVIQDGKFLKVGGQKELSTDIRIISATNKNLKELVAKGSFREDLYFRLNVIPIILPPLYKRKEDIIILSLFYLDFYNKKYNIHKKLSGDVIRKFLNYNWPGNVRELRNNIERLVLISGKNIIVPEDLIYSNFAVKELHFEKNNLDFKDIDLNIDEETEGSLKDIINEFEKKVILKAVKKYGCQRKAADALKVSPSTISRKLRNMNCKDFC